MRKSLKSTAITSDRMMMASKSTLDVLSTLKWELTNILIAAENGLSRPDVEEPSFEIDGINQQFDTIRIHATISLKYLEEQIKKIAKGEEQ